MRVRRDEDCRQSKRPPPRVRGSWRCLIDNSTSLPGMLLLVSACQDDSAVWYSCPTQRQTRTQPVLERPKLHHIVIGHAAVAGADGCLQRAEVVAHVVRVLAGLLPRASTHRRQSRQCRTPRPPPTSVGLAEDPQRVRLP